MLWGMLALLTTWGVLREDRRGPEPPKSTVKHQLLFRLDRLCVAGVSPHQKVHHRHLSTKGKNDEARKLVNNKTVLSVWLCFKRTVIDLFQMSYLLLMGQERHQHQRSAWLHTLHHRRRHINDVQCNIPAYLQQKGPQSQRSHKSNTSAFTKEDRHSSFFYHCSLFLSCSLGQYTVASAFEALELEDAWVVKRQVLHGVPGWGTETF